MNNRITIRDVAKEADVSIATVSKALNDVDVVKPETKQKILDVANRLHYVPNLMGKQLKSGETHMLGFYTNTISGPYFSPLVEAMRKEAEILGYGLNVCITTNKKIITNNIMGHVVDGIIGFEDLITEKDIEAIKRERIKAVFIDRKTTAQSIGSVVFDSYQKGKEITRYLIAKGHRRIAFLIGFSGVYDSDERFSGYRDALAEAQIPFDPSLILAGEFEKEAAYDAVKNYLLQNPAKNVTAFLAGNDLSAIGTVTALKALGYQVPADFSVAGFDGIDLLEYFQPKLTTVKNPILEQGEMAIRHLVALIRGEVEGTSYELVGKIVEGESVQKI